MRISHNDVNLYYLHKFLSSLRTGLSIHLHRKRLYQLKQHKYGLIGETIETTDVLKNAYLDLNFIQNLIILLCFVFGCNWVSL